jgi:DEAD/DEAH box helicase domain-containing protein
VGRGQQVFTINDNYGSLYCMDRVDDGSVIVDDPALYTDPPQLECRKLSSLDGAIGFVASSDVLIVALRDLDVPGPSGVIPVWGAPGRRTMPGAESALWSFAQLFRLACADELDVGIDELRVGLQAARIDGQLTRRVFLADALENGAGYAVYLGQRIVLERVLARMRIDLRERFESATHSAMCDTSCPDCLRSYENRQVHGLLDWRLALDVADLASGGQLVLSRWLDRGTALATGFVKAYQSAVDVRALELCGLAALLNAKNGRAILLGHPLWRHEKDFWTAEQAEACEEARETSGASQVLASDLFVLARQPQAIYTQLVQG